MLRAKALVKLVVPKEVILSVKNYERSYKAIESKDIYSEVFINTDEAGMKALEKGKFIPIDGKSYVVSDLIPVGNFKYKFNEAVKAVAGPYLGLKGSIIDVLFDATDGKRKYIVQENTSSAFICSEDELEVK